MAEPRTKTVFLCLSLAFPFCLRTGGTLCADITLVREGKPMSIIVVTEKPTKTAKFAAAELRTHLQKMSGAAVPVVGPEADRRVDKRLAPNQARLAAFGSAARPATVRERAEATPAR